MMTMMTLIPMIGITMGDTMTKQLNIKEYVQQEKERLRQADIEPLHIVIIDPTNHDAGNQLYLHGILKDFSSLGWKTTVARRI